MKLAAPTDVLLTMGLNTDEGRIKSAGRALDLSFPIIENILETKFSKGGRLDFFEGFPTSKSPLRLENNFVDKDSVIVRQATKDQPLLASSTDGTTLDQSQYRLNVEYGYLTLLITPDVTPYSISVGYDYGLPSSDGNDDILEAPYWLRECAISMAVFVLNTHPSSTANRNVRNVGNVALELHRMATLLLNSHRRPRLLQVMPTWGMDNG